MSDFGSERSFSLTHEQGDGTPEQTDMDEENLEEQFLLDETCELDRSLVNIIAEAIKEGDEDIFTKYSAMLSSDVGSIKCLGTSLNELLAQTTGLRGPCRKQVDGANTKFCYRCMDCSVSNNTLLCSECFEKGNHKGHR